MKAHRSRIALRTLFVSVTLLLPSIGSAQHEGSGQWNLFGTVGRWTELRGTQVGVGIGYERLIYKGLGAGAEIQGYGSSQNYAGAIVSANGSYHFRSLSEPRKIVPFGTVGVSSIGVCSSECGGAGGFNFGGGVNYWPKPHRGLRVEFRDHVFNNFSDSHKWEIRVGFAF